MLDFAPPDGYSPGGMMSDKAPQKSTVRIVFYLLLVAGICLLGYAWFAARKDATDSSSQRANIYDADVPLSMVPESLHPGALLLSPYQLVDVPVIDGFTAPMGDERGMGTYVAQPFGVMNSERGGVHAGQDWNGIGGEDSDFGDAVYAAGRGLVVYAGKPSDGWGNVVVLVHRTPDGRVLQSLYAHLSKVNVRVGEVVGRGRMIGEAGSADGRYLAHLHFEFAESLAVEAGQPGYSKGSMNRLDPDAVLKQYALPDKASLADPLGDVQAFGDVEVGKQAGSPESEGDGVLRINPAIWLDAASGE